MKLGEVKKVGYDQKQPTVDELQKQILEMNKVMGELLRTKQLRESLHTIIECGVIDLDKDLSNTVSIIRVPPKNKIVPSVKTFNKDASYIYKLGVCILGALDGISIVDPGLKIEIVYEMEGENLDALNEGKNPFADILGKPAEVALYEEIAKVAKKFPHIVEFTRGDLTPEFYKLLGSIGQDYKIWKEKENADISGSSGSGPGSPSGGEEV